MRKVKYPISGREYIKEINKGNVAILSRLPAHIYMIARDLEKFKDNDEKCLCYYLINLLNAYYSDKEKYKDCLEIVKNEMSKLSKDNQLRIESDLYGKGIIYEKDREKAAQCREEAIKINPRDADYYFLAVYFAEILKGHENEVPELIEILLKKEYPRVYGFYGHLLCHGIIFKKDRNLGLKFLQEGIKRNDYMPYISMYYLNRKTNPSYAFKCAKKAQKLRQGYASYVLAECYYFGTGVEKNYELVFKYAKEASLFKYDRGKLVEAEMYLKGQGTKKNVYHAIVLLNNYSGKTDLGYYNYLMGQCCLDKQYPERFKAVDYFEKVLEDHDGISENAAYKIGDFFKNTMQDNKKADEFYRLAKTIEEEVIFEED